jgi:hypothetical protein
VHAPPACSSFLCFHSFVVALFGWVVLRLMSSTNATHCLMFLAAPPRAVLPVSVAPRAPSPIDDLYGDLGVEAFQPPAVSVSKPDSDDPKSGDAYDDEDNAPLSIGRKSVKRAAPEGPPLVVAPQPKAGKATSIAPPQIFQEVECQREHLHDLATLKAPCIVIEGAPYNIL